MIFVLFTKLFRLKSVTLGYSQMKNIKQEKLKKLPREAICGWKKLHFNF